MAVFTYEALDATGKPAKGTVEAGNNQEAIQQLKLKGFYPTTVKEQKGKKSGGAKKPAAGGAKKKKKKGGAGAITFGGVSAKELTLFTRQMSTLQDAGLPLLRSLHILENQLKPGKLKKVLGDVAEDVEGGSSLSESMAKHPKVFNKLYTKMVAAGEAGGVLDVILQRLSDFMEKAQALKRKVIGALIYPAVVIFVALLILTGIMVLIIPQFVEIFTDFGIELPALTLFLMNTSDWMVGKLSEDQAVPGAFIVLGAPVAIFFLYKLLRKTPPGRAALDWTFLRAPVFGNLIKKTVIARFTRTLGTLINAGVPILEAINITKETSGNWVYERALGKVHDSIREGESFAGPLRETKVCDSLVVNMIDVGEETGDLDKMLEKIADNYDEEVDNAVAGLVSLLEPIMVVVLGGIVGFIVVSLFLPLVKLMQDVM